MSHAPKQSPSQILMSAFVCSRKKSTICVAIGFRPSGNCRRTVFAFVFFISSVILSSSRSYFFCISFRFMEFLGKLL